MKRRKTAARTASAGADDHALRRTGGRASYAAILTFSALLALFVGGTLSYALFYTVLALLPLSLLHVWIISRRIRFLQKTWPQELQKGQSAEWRFAFRNKSFLPAPWLEALPLECPGFPESLPDYRPSLLPRGTQKYSVAIRFRYRGEYDIGLKHLAVWDTLKIFRLKLDPGAPLCVRVYPRLLELRKLSLTQPADSERPRPIAQDSDEPLSETRKYVPGDTLSRIHWNLTARNQELTTRLFAKESELRVLCLLDLRSFESPDVPLCEDAVIEAGLAAARHVLSQGITMTFVFASGHEVFTYEQRDMSRFQELYHACAALRFDAELPPHLLPARLPEAQHILLFTAHDVTDELLRSIPPDVYLRVFRVKHFRDEPIPSHGATRNVSVTALTADGDFAAEMEG